MIRSALPLLLLALALPAGALAAASSDEAGHLCPKSKSIVPAAPEADAPAPSTPASTAVKSASPHVTGGPAIRNPAQRWQSLLPGMIR